MFRPKYTNDLYIQEASIHIVVHFIDVKNSKIRRKANDLSNSIEHEGDFPYSIRKLKDKWIIEDTPNKLFAYLTINQSGILK